jgi:hypothetical protein
MGNQWIDGLECAILTKKKAKEVQKKKAEYTEGPEAG